MSQDRAIYKCPVCGLLFHFQKALEVHQKHRNHYAEPEAVNEPEQKPETVVEEVTAKEPAVVVEKKARKPRKKAVKESEE